VERQNKNKNKTESKPNELRPVCRDLYTTCARKLIVSS